MTSADVKVNEASLLRCPSIYLQSNFPWPCTALSHNAQVQNDRTQQPAHDFVFALRYLFAIREASSASDSAQRPQRSGMRRS
eukprot:1723882-Prymnesium_polylepis.2